MSTFMDHLDDYREPDRCIAKNCVNEAMYCSLECAQADKLPAQGADEPGTVTGPRAWEGDTAPLHAAMLPPAVPQGVAAEPTREPDIGKLRLLTTSPLPDCQDEEEDGRLTFYGDLTELVRLFREEFVEEGQRGDDEGWTTDETAARLIRSQSESLAALRGPLLHHFGTTDPALLAEVWDDQATSIAALRQSLASAEARATSLTEDAERWRWFRQWLSVEDDAQAGGQYLLIHDLECGHIKVQPGYENTVESFVDDAIARAALSPSPSEPAR